MTAAAARGVGFHRAQQYLRALAVALVFQPNLGLRHIGRHVADDARRVLVEDVRAYAGLSQPIREEIGVVALARDVEPEHRATPDAMR